MLQMGVAGRSAHLIATGSRSLRVLGRVAVAEAGRWRMRFKAQQSPVQERELCMSTDTHSPLHRCNLSPAVILSKTTRPTGYSTRKGARDSSRKKVFKKNFFLV